MPEEERKISPAVVIVGGLGLGLAAAGVVYALSRAARPPEVPPVPGPSLANLYGVVIDAESEQGIPDVLVTLDTEYTYTDKDGYYSFLDLEPRDYSVMFSKEGYKTVVLEKAVREGNNELNAALWLYALAELLLDGLRVTWTGAYEDKIMVGDTVHVWARAQNIGTEPGVWQITWRVGEETQTELLELEGKQIKQIAFTYFVPESPGVYEVEVNGLTGSFKVIEEEVKPVAVITSMDWGKIPKRQGDTFGITIHIQSNFKGSVWVVGAYGQGKPSPGASLRAIYNRFGDFLGFFPYPFKIIDTPEVTILPFVGSIELKVGDNVFTMGQSIPRNYPIGTYLAYAAVMPPAANWYQWPDPYDWKIGSPFDILEEPPPISYLSPYIYAEMSCSRGQFWPGVSTAVDIGSFDKTNNYICAFNVGNFSSHPDWCAKQAYYMKFKRPGIDIEQPLLGCLKYKNRLYLGVDIEAHPPSALDGSPARTYHVDIDAVLVKPDGTEEQRSLSDRIPTVVYERWMTEWFFKVFAFEETAEMETGTYTFWVKVVIEGIEMYEGERNFTVVE